MIFSYNKGYTMQKRNWYFTILLPVLFSLFNILFIRECAIAQKKNFTLEEIFMGGKFMGKSIRGMKWMKNGTSYSFLETGKDAKSPYIWMYDCNKDSKEQTIDLSQIKEPGSDTPLSMTEYLWSPDETQILFTAHVKVIWRHSRTAQYFLYDIKSGSLKNISKGDGEVMNAKFSPDGKKIVAHGFPFGLMIII